MKSNTTNIFMSSIQSPAVSSPTHTFYVYLKCLIPWNSVVVEGTWTFKLLYTLQCQWESSIPFLLYRDLNPYVMLEFIPVSFTHFSTSSSHYLFLVLRIALCCWSPFWPPSICVCTMAVQHNTFPFQSSVTGCLLLMETRLLCIFFLHLDVIVKCYCNMLSWSVHVFCFVFNSGNWIHMLVHTVLSCESLQAIKLHQGELNAYKAVCDKLRHYSLSH